MVIKNSFKILLCATTLLGVFSAQVRAENVVKNTAQMQALDKVTGQMKVINVPVNGAVEFGSFSVVVRSCQTTPPEEVPENYAFVDVADTNRDGEMYNIFKGWMVSSSPSLNSVEHPVYDVWLLKCINDSSPKSILTQEQLEERDNLKKLTSEILSKEAQIAIEVQEEQAKKEELAKVEEEARRKIKEEEKETQNLMNEIEKELDNRSAPTISAQVTDNDEDGGPVSLLNITEKTNNPKDDNIPIVPEAEKNDSDEHSVIEDTNNDEISSVLSLPSDIEEILPQIQKNKQE